jgi:hypothetical protein
MAQVGHDTTTAEHRRQRETTSTRSRSSIETSTPSATNPFHNRLVPVKHHWVHRTRTAWRCVGHWLTGRHHSVPARPEPERADGCSSRGALPGPLNPSLASCRPASLVNTCSNVSTCRMGPHCSFCGTFTGPLSQVEDLFTVLICIPCLEVRLAPPDTLLGLHDPGHPPSLTPVVVDVEFGHGFWAPPGSIGGRPRRLPQKRGRSATP